MKILHSFLIANALLFIVSCTTYKSASDVSLSGIERNLNYLASDDLQGRYPGTRGDAMAGSYIENCFRNQKLQPMSQEFSFLQYLKRGSENYIKVNGKSIPGERFSPFGFSKDTIISSEVVFVGYGLSVKTDSFEWDDYARVDVKGKWVLALRGYPDLPEFEDYLSISSGDRDKAMLAGDKGAAGLILVSGYSYDAGDRLAEVHEKLAKTGIPVFQVSRQWADSLLKVNHMVLKDVEPLLKTPSVSHELLKGVTIDARSQVENIMGTTANHYAIIEGSDPVLKDEYIVIGAHFDHLGTGGPGSSSRRPDTVAVHNGADDNASGVTAMLELAGMISKNRGSMKRSFVFVAFGGEEMGLLGSKYFVNHFPVDISKVVAMINLDMVGRLDYNKGLQVGGTGTSAEADSLISMANTKVALKISKSREGSGPSDHSSFYGKDIPVFFLTTGAHSDYHTPDDDVRKINMQGMKEVTQFAYNLASDISALPGKLTFREAGPKQESAGPGYRFKVTLGFMPDFSDNDIEGVRVDFVSKGKAAERGGIKNGDIIKAIDGLPVKNIYDYMYRLGKLTKNQIISVEVLRNGAKEVLIIQL
ncbi:MAG TPA: M20/M25/M40 family metallo-hydrolase [Bacteroidales bacterium]|nr:M20/M25/M40 family metallo-hydrolase [Bacteroidales bacterium]